MSRNPKFEGHLERMKAVHEAKNADYAHDGNPYSNFEFAATLVKEFKDPVDQVFAGLIGVKLARLGELRSNGKEPKNESIADTHLDLSNYAALWATYRETHP